MRSFIAFIKKERHENWVYDWGFQEFVKDPTSWLCYSIPPIQFLHEITVSSCLRQDTRFGVDIVKVAYR